MSRQQRWTLASPPPPPPLPSFLGISIQPAEASGQGPGSQGLEGGGPGVSPDCSLQRFAGAADVRGRLPKSREAVRLLFLELRKGPTPGTVRPVRRPARR